MYHRTTLSRNPHAQPVFANGRKVAELIGDTIVRYKTLRYRAGNSYGFNKQTLAACVKRGATHARCQDADTGAWYITPIARIYQHGFEVDHGHGAQIHLAVPLWDQVAGETVVEAQVQGSLFGEVAHG